MRSLLSLDVGGTLLFWIRYQSVLILAPEIGDSELSTSGI